MRDPYEQINRIASQVMAEHQKAEPDVFKNYSGDSSDPWLEETRKQVIFLFDSASFEHDDYWRAGSDLVRGEEYEQLKQRFARKLLDRAEEQLPGLKDHILNLDIATPVTMYRYTLNTTGAPVGWSYTSRRRWKQRIPFVTGLYLAGHWYGPSGIYNVTLSGKNAAALVLRDG
jgi:hypothetical protein